MRKGFTFVELLVSVTIVAVLAAIGAVAYSSTSKRSRDTKRTADIQSIRSGLEIHRSEVGNYPSLLPGGGGCITSTQIENAGVIYLNPIPTDPINNATYCYRYTRGGSPYTTYTLTCTLESGAACSYANP
ncbi:prepilin-type N-terminal cleavage/methylation domain-containing protein [Candidatus Collierbacteria bacterium]|nr:prepilin-type N-terminal cleavage/methylation domain-containing protein [Candidatus Collierbacteria bacterium]